MKKSEIPSQHEVMEDWLTSLHAGRAQGRNRSSESIETFGLLTFIEFIPDIARVVIPERQYLLVVTSEYVELNKSRISQRVMLLSIP